MSWEDGDVGESPISEFVLFNFPRPKLNPEFDFDFVSPVLGVEGEGGLGDVGVAVFVEVLRGAIEDVSMKEPVGVPSLEVVVSVDSWRGGGGGETLLRG
jgi:hypothetical protein